MIAGITGTTTGLTVAAGLAQGLIEVAVARGASQAELCRCADIDPRALEDQDTRIPFASYVALMRAGQALCADPALGLHFGETNDLSRLSIVGLIGNASETLLESLAQLNRYGRLVIEFDGGPERFRLAHEPGGLWLVDQRRNPDDFPELTESTFARMVAGGRRAGLPPLVRQVQVTHAAPSYASEYARIFQVPVAFEAPRNALQLDETFLTARLQPQPRYVFGILSERAETLLKELESSKTVRGRVESLLMPVLHKGDASMETIAEKMATSRQTLFRKLKAEGTNFEKVLDALRHKLALHYLSGRKVSVNQTAYLVGFSDPAAFSRAFKRWTGVSPRDFKGASR